jgi:hypothetical protein
MSDDTWLGGANVGKLLENEAKRYPYSPLEGLIVEGIANSLDDQIAGANQIDINTKRVDKWTFLLTITDNGRGMKNWEVLKEFHKLGSKSKKITVGDIGFVGVGSHVYITKAKCQHTETKNINGFHERVRWLYDTTVEDTRCSKELATDEIKTPSGTRITVEIIDKEDTERLSNDEYIKEMIRRHWNAVLLGLYGDKTIIVNGEKVEPFLPEEELHKIREFNIGRQKYKTIFYETKDDVPEEWQDIFIVTGKKIIMPVKDYFRVFPDETIRDKVYGYIIADGLIDIINSGKDGFKKSKLRNEFEQKSAKEWKKFLEFLGFGGIKRKDENSVKYTKKLDLLLKQDKWKKYKKLFEKIVKAPAKRKCPVCGTENYHAWKNDDAYYECENGHLFKKKYTWSRTGHTPVTPPSVKKPKSGIEVAITESDEYLEAWVDGANRKIYINTKRETYKDAKNNKKAKDIHWKRCIAKTMINELVKQTVMTSEEAKKEFFELYEAL